MIYVLVILFIMNSYATKIQYIDNMNNGVFLDISNNDALVGITSKIKSECNVTISDKRVSYYWYGSGLTGCRGFVSDWTIYRDGNFCNGILINNIVSVHCCDVLLIHSMWFWFGIIISIICISLIFWMIYLCTCEIIRSKSNVNSIEV